MTVISLTNIVNAEIMVTVVILLSIKNITNNVVNVISNVINLHVKNEDAGVDDDGDGYSYNDNK